MANAHVLGPSDQPQPEDDGGGGQVLTFAGPLAASVADLEQFFGSHRDHGNLDAALGVRAQNYSGGGRLVFDAQGEADFFNDSWVNSASGRLHRSKLDPRHRHALRVHTRIWRTLASLPAETQRILRLAFTPRRFSAWQTMADPDEKPRDGRWVEERERGKTKSKGIPIDERQLRIILSLRRAEGRSADRRKIGAEEHVPAATLIDLALTSGIAHAVHHDRMAPGEPVSAHVVVLWLLDLAAMSLRDDVARERRTNAMSALVEVRERTGAVLMPHLRLYEEKRREARDAEIAEDAARPQKFVEQWQAPVEPSRRTRRVVDKMKPDDWAAIREFLLGDEAAE